uniref:Uncharacterized protein n=1 Tax=Arundo donax TaxID=35708 RepID=A0A0A9DBJ0_ARUDO
MLFFLLRLKNRPYGKLEWGGGRITSANSYATLALRWMSPGDESDLSALSH